MILIIMETIDKKVNPRNIMKVIARIARALHGRSVKQEGSTILLGCVPVCVKKGNKIYLIIGVDQAETIAWPAEDIESSWRNLALGNIIDIQPDRVIIIDEMKSKTYTRWGILSSIARENGEKAIVECYGRVPCDHTHEHPFVRWSRRDFGPATMIKGVPVTFWWYGETVPRAHYKMLSLCPIWVNGGKWPEEFPYTFTSPAGESITVTGRNIPRDIEILFGRINLFQWTLNNRSLLRAPYRDQFYRWREAQYNYIEETKKWYERAIIATESEWVDLRSILPHEPAPPPNPVAADYEVFQWEFRYHRKTARE